MIKIPIKVQQMLKSQKVIVVGSVDINGLANLSPRTFYFTDTAIYWLDFFKHKSQGNFKSIPGVSVEIFDKKELTGYQIKGKVTFVTEPKEKSRITDVITCSVTGETSSTIFERMSQNKTPDVIMFTPKVDTRLIPRKSWSSNIDGKKR
jgi:hypothetical protein